MDKRESSFWISIRQAVLLLVDTIEREIGMSPTTAEIRQQYKLRQREGDAERDSDG